MIKFGIACYTLALLCGVALVTTVAGWLIFHIGMAIPSTVHVFTDIALNAFCAVLLVILIGGLMVGLTLLIAAMAYYLVMLLWSFRLRVEDF